MSIGQRVIDAFSGDDLAWAEIDRGVRALLGKQLRNREICDDEFNEIVQKILLRIFQNFSLKKAPTPGQAGAFVMSTIRFAVIRHFQRESVDPLRRKPRRKGTPDPKPYPVMGLYRRNAAYEEARKVSVGRDWEIRSNDILSISDYWHRKRTEVCVASSGWISRIITTNKKDAALLTKAADSRRQKGFSLVRDRRNTYLSCPRCTVKIKIPPRVLRKIEQQFTALENLHENSDVLDETAAKPYSRRV